MAIDETRRLRALAFARDLERLAGALCAELEGEASPPDPGPHLVRFQWGGRRLGGHRASPQADGEGM